MLEKMVLKRLLHKWRQGGFSVVFWDGEKEDFGCEPPAFTVIFHHKPSLPVSGEDAMLILGEAYMDGILDIEGSMDDVMHLIARNQQERHPPGEKVFEASAQGGTDTAMQQRNIHHHYDLGNDFFALWLDPGMSYSCAYYHDPGDSLEQAQEQKIGHILKKLHLQAGERLLDIGSGWGALIIRAAREYHVRATGVTLSEEQYESTRKRIQELGLDGQVEVRLCSYLDLKAAEDQFDKIVSVGMFEHVGQGNLARYMSKVGELLVPGGISLLHTITGMFEENANAWMTKYIFPGGYVPSLRETMWLLPEFDFHLLHAESLRLHYALTLDQWYRNFAVHVDEVRSRYGERFVRMWSLYLRGCAAAFRSAGLDIHQLLFSKGLNNDLPLTYEYVYNEK